MQGAALYLPLDVVREVEYVADIGDRHAADPVASKDDRFLFGREVCVTESLASPPVGGSME